MQVDLAERFWSKVQKSDGCWEWLAGKHRTKGYGQFYINNKPVAAHYVSYALTHGCEMNGMRLIRHCSNVFCVNPEHYTTPIIASICQHCKYPDERICQIDGHCRRCRYYTITYGRLPPRRMVYEACRCCKRPKNKGVWFIHGRCCTCHLYRYRYGIDRPQRLIDRQVPHGWCDCGKPAVTVQTFQFGKQRETFRLCQECSE